MSTPVKIRKAWEKIIVALGLFDYLTAYQLARLLYSPASISRVRKELKSLTAASLALSLGGRAVNLPLVYTLSSKGRQSAASLGVSASRRLRPSEEKDKGYNPYFLKHTIAVTDVLIAAQLLSQTVPWIELTRILTERELKRRIYVELPEKVCIEPDASCEFLLTETWHKTTQTWKDFFHIEVYRNLPPAEWRVKQKIHGYVAYMESGQHEPLFNTSALSIAVIAQTKQMATTLKRWAEEVLTDTERQAEGEWFFFCSLNPATASPEELFLTPIWEQAFSTTTTSLLVLE
jgi:protein involved in plasmid replication-relaxation